MAEGKRYYWLKLYDDFFGSMRIKKLRKMAGGDTYTIIYLKMQLKAMKHDGMIQWTGLEEDIAAELALDLDESVDDVKITLAYLLGNGLAETSDNVSYYFPYAVSNTGSESASTQRSRECRARHVEGLQPPKTNAERQSNFRAKKACNENGHVPFIEDYTNNKRYGGNYYICFKRDNCCCAMCGSIEYLCMHHIDGYDEDKPENNDANKLVTLCRSCHSQVHGGLEIPAEVLDRIGYYSESNASNESNVTVTRNGSVEIEKETRVREKTIYCRVIDYLNEKTGKNFRASSKAHKAHINARVAEGHTFEDFQTVIDNKCFDWLGTKMEEYLRPETLFGTKFDSYLNERSKANGSDGRSYGEVL